MRQGGEIKPSSVLPEKRRKRARLLPARAEGASVVAWEGAVPSDAVLNIQIHSRLGKERASKCKSPTDEYNLFPGRVRAQQMTPQRV